MGEIVEREVVITQEFIDAGCHEADNCPVARALKVAFPEGNSFGVCSSSWGVGFEGADGEYRRIAGGPLFHERPGMWVSDYDTGRDVEPFSFKVAGILGEQGWEIVREPVTV